MVSTPDLLLDLPGAVWLPVVVDTELWRPGPPVLEREVPVVLHARRARQPRARTTSTACWRRWPVRAGSSTAGCRG